MGGLQPPTPPSRGYATESVNNLQYSVVKDGRNGAACVAGIGF